jgi:hypothetical protein
MDVKPQRTGADMNELMSYRKLDRRGVRQFTFRTVAKLSQNPRSGGLRQSRFPL